jgi:hypothetical protein
MLDAKRIKEACEKHWEANKSDCSGFARAVAGELGVILTGNADAIVAAIGQAGAWTSVSDGVAAKQKADAGHLVIGGLKGSAHQPARAHGHVVVVVAGNLALGKYPTGYWGSLGAVGKMNTTINWAWNKADRDNVHYAYKVV